MANVLEMQILEEGPRNAVVKLTGVLTNSDVTEMSVIDLNNFSNNDVRQRLSGFRVDHITYSLGQQIDVALYWNSNSPQQIAPLSKAGKIDVSGDGGFVPDPLRSGYDGSINLI